MASARRARKKKDEPSRHPPRPRSKAGAKLLARARALCLALPGATEKEAWGAPTFRVRDRLFAMFADNHHGDGRVALWCKAPEGVQALMVGAAPERFFVPPYVGPSGWVGVRLDVGTEWDEVAAIVADGYRMTAPARLTKILDGRDAAPPDGPLPSRAGRRRGGATR